MINSKTSLQLILKRGNMAALAWTTLIAIIASHQGLFAHEQPTAIYLIRHAQTEWNAQKRIQGAGSNPSLSAQGKEQAQMLADKIIRNYSDITAVYSSDLNRALETAQAFAGPLGLTVQKTEKLREIRWCQDIEGLVATEESLGTERYYQWRDGRIPGSETIDEVVARMHSIVGEIVQQHSGEKVALVSSGRATSLFLKSILAENLLPSIDNCTIITLTTSDGVSFTLSRVDRLEAIQHNKKGWRG